MKKVRIGVIGSGYWGPNLIRNFSENTGSEVVGVADLREDRLAAVRNSYHKVVTTKDYHDLFTMGLDAVVVSTPPATHYPIAREALAAGLNVLIEKPMTTTTQDAEDLIELAARKDRILMVGHTFEFNPAVHALKRLIASGEIGDIYYIDTARLNLGLYNRDLNVIWDLAPHDISIILSLLGTKPEAIEVYGMACVMKGVHDVAYMNLVFPNNILVHVHVSWLDPCKVRRVTVVGSKKMVVYNDIEASEKIKIYDKGVDVPEYTNTFGEFQCSYRYGDVVIPNIKFTEPLRLEAQHFLDCIVNHTTPVTAGESGLQVVKILETAQHALSNGHYAEVLTW